MGHDHRLFSAAFNGLELFFNLWQRRNKDERRRALESALKDYARGMTMEDDDPFFGQLKPPVRPRE
jgi:hypothetical protein